MKLNYTYSRLLWVKKNKVRNGEAPIYLRITIDGVRTEIATKKWFALDKWNPATQTVRGNTEEIRIANTFLQTLLSKVDRIHFDLSMQDRIPLPEEIKNHLFGVDDKPKHKTICEAFDYHNLKMADLVKIGKISPKTLLRYKITKNKVVDYMERKFKSSDMPLPELRLAFITEFEHHLLTVDKIQSNTAHKYIKNLKKFDGYQIIHKNSKSSNVYCFDDLGIEQNIKHFGNECNTMAEILLSRYEHLIHSRVLTHGTTNLNANELETMYGNRVRSRLREMFNLISFPASARDKRK